MFFSKGLIGRLESKSLKSLFFRRLYTMKDFIKMVAVLAITVIIPLVVLLAIWYFDHPIVDMVQIGIAQFAVYFSIIYIVGFTLWMVYSDIKTKRYAKA